MISSYGEFLDVSCYSCQNIDLKKELKHFKNKCQVVIGTPNRIYDIFKQKPSYLKHVQLFIVDDADRDMEIRMGKRSLMEQLYDVFSLIPEETRAKVQVSSNMTDFTC